MNGFWTLAGKVSVLSLSGDDVSEPANRCPPANLQFHECRVQLLTPVGRSAVATVAVVGQQAAKAVDLCFRRANQQPLSELATQTIAYGTWLGRTETTDPDSQGEGVVVVRTQDDAVEIHCHGGSVAAERIVSDLLRIGCQRRHAPSKDEPLRVEEEARQALANALTEKTALILLDQWNLSLIHI